MNILTHDKPHFYKYCTSNTLKKILTNQTVKWSSPSIFNDPFDIQTDLRFGFQLEDLEEPLLQEQVSIVWDDDEPKGDPEQPFFNSMLQARKNRISRPDIGSREEFEKYFRDVEFDKKGIESELEATKDFWKGFSKNLRVYCVSEHHDDILMWSHYAGDHSGAVIKHKVIPGKDYPICAAMPVQYREVMPVIAGVDDYIKHVTGQKELDFKQITIVFFTTKNKDWSYEREWRCVGPPASASEGLFDFFHMAPEEIEAIYFGCRMTENDREKIIENMSPDFFHVKLFQAKKHPEKYALDFDLIERDSEIVS